MPNNRQALTKIQSRIIPQYMHLFFIQNSYNLRVL